MVSSRLSQSVNKLAKCSVGERSRKMLAALGNPEIAIATAKVLNW